MALLGVILGAGACGETGEKQPPTGPACEGRLVCGSDGKVYAQNTCTLELAYFRTCSPGTTCTAGECVAPHLNPHVGALFSFANMPFGFTKVSFPHGDFAYEPPVVGSCVAILDPDSPPREPPAEDATQVVLWGPSGEGMHLPEMVTGPYPYYLLAHDDRWPAEAAAGQTFRWQVQGKGDVPDFEVSFIAPEPITTVSPLPKGEGLIDFSRAAPPVVTWNRGTFLGQQIAISLRGGDAEKIGTGRTLTCYPPERGRSSCRRAKC